MARTLIRVPPFPRRGEVMEIRTTIAHVMETGFRPDGDGKTVPRDILRRFTCKYNGEQVFSAELAPAISANPYITFFVTATTSGPLTLTWEGDNGFAQTETVNLNVA